MIKKSGINPRARLHVGTSGWHYKHWRGPFYSADIKGEHMLRAYVRNFDTVEINNSFYRLPTVEAIKQWVKQTPPEFIFAVKASRYITHNRKLKDPEQTSARFLEIVKSFGKKLGPILFQLPPAWKVNQERLEEFLAALPKRYRYAFEFRNPTWHTPEIVGVLRKHNAAFCIFNLNHFQSDFHVTADFVYIRLHGPGNAYQGDYPASALRIWAQRIRSWIGENRQVFLYFDNDQAGFAAKNAMELCDFSRRSAPIKQSVRLAG
jgi:uncharacterized protein YecE (DUF72 family)